MIDSIFIALSGLKGNERGLNVISNNIANMNSVGFRGSRVNFRDVFSGAPGNARQPGEQGRGGGLDFSGTLLDLRSGDPQQTEQPLDLRLDGSGFFVLQDENGELRYTRDGSFQFSTEGVLMDRGQRLKVLSRNASGQLAPVQLKNLRMNPAKATGTVTLNGTLSATDPMHTIDSVNVFDKSGGKHTLRLEFSNATSMTSDGMTSSDASGAHRKVTVFEGVTEIGSGELLFEGASVAPGSMTLRMTLNLANTDPTEIAFDCTAANSIDAGESSNLRVVGQDGFTLGTIEPENFNNQTFDEQGVLKLSYSNGQMLDGPTLALAQIGDASGLVQLGDALFAYRGAQSVALRSAGEELRVVSRSLERSNVQLTEQFSDLILTQRGYQASSQVVSTANDMLQELLELRNRR